MEELEEGEPKSRHLCFASHYQFSLLLETGSQISCEKSSVLFSHVGRIFSNTSCIGLNQLDYTSHMAQ